MTIEREKEGERLQEHNTALNAAVGGGGGGLIKSRLRDAKWKGLGGRQTDEGGGLSPVQSKQATLYRRAPND